MNKILNSFPASLLLSLTVVSLAFVYSSNADNLAFNNQQNLESKVLPESGVMLPVVWGDLGKKLVEAGVVDEKKFKELYQSRGGLSEADHKLFLSDNRENIKITRENAQYILNLFWALGLANKNVILEEGSMMDSQYGGAENFASTGGWTLAKGGAMNHYGRHRFFDLTFEQQKLVEEVSKNIYRPCCNNSTYFPDCNHGMAMLGLLELLASQGANEEQMYQAALTVNSYWFPDTYLTIASYLESQNIPWEKVDPRSVLGESYSSASGYAKVASVMRERRQGGGSCGV